MLENLPSLAPSAFFTFTMQILYSEKGLPIEKKLPRSYFLPDMSFLFGEEKFAEVAASFSESGLSFDFYVQVAPQTSFFPAFRGGDAVEIFIDTRDLKSAGSLTRFCHHFVFLPQSVDGITCWEVTRFRTDDTHVLCSPEQLTCQVDVNKSSYRMRVVIPTECLYGYDPAAFDRIGFTYLISRFGDTPQHFVISSKDYTIEQNPSLWSSCLLLPNKKEKK